MNVTLRKTRMLTIVAAALLTSTVAQAAVLAGIEGPVLVNTGVGFQLTKGPVELKPGDLVMAYTGSNAQLSYPDGCSVPLATGTVVTIGAQSPCATQAPQNNTPPPQPTAGLNTGTLVVGGLVVAGGIGAALALGGKSSSSAPASP